MTVRESQRGSISLPASEENSRLLTPRQIISNGGGPSKLAISARACTSQIRLSLGIIAIKPVFVLDRVPNLPVAWVRARARNARIRVRESTDYNTDIPYIYWVSPVNFELASWFRF